MMDYDGHTEALAERPGPAALSSVEPMLASLVQAWFWAMQVMNEDDVSLNESEMLLVEGPLDYEAFREGLAAVVKRHASLRTTFAQRDEGPVQIIHDHLEIRLDVVDLSGIASDERLGAAEQYAERQRRRPFDLRRGPLLRCSLIKLAPDEHRLLLVAHHIVVDRWSFHVFLRDLSAFYGERVSGAPAGLPVLSSQFAEFVSREQRWLKSPEYARRAAFWRSYLTGERPLFRLAPDVGPASNYEAAEVHDTLAPEVARALRDVGKAFNVTPFMTLLTAFCIMLQKITGRHDILVGCPIADRSHGETENLIGFLLNTLVLRVDCVTASTFADILVLVRDSSLDAYAHQMPYTALLKALDLDQEWLASPFDPFTDVVINFFDNTKMVRWLHDLSLSPVVGPLAASRYAVLEPYLFLNPDGWTVMFKYQKAVFSDDWVRNFANEYHRLVRLIVDDPHASLREYAPKL